MTLEVKAGVAPVGLTMTRHVCSKVLMLGAGFVTRPTLDILSDAGIQVTVGATKPLLPLT